MAHRNETHVSPATSALMLPITLLVEAITGIGERHQGRADARRLWAMTDHELSDIGISRGEIDRVTSRRRPEW